MSDKQILKSPLWDKNLPAGNLIDLLLLRTKTHPDRIAYYFLEDGVNEKETLSFRQLEIRVKACATRLQEMDCKKGDTIVLLFPTGIDFIVAFFASIFAGGIAVPAYAPRRNRNNERFWSIMNDSESKIIITTEQILKDINRHFKDDKGFENVEFLTVESIDKEYAKKWRKPEIVTDDLATLQYTSGSTGWPKGVMVSHSNILHNAEAVKRSFGFNDSTIGVNWLPNFHDMGLFGALMQVPYSGYCNVIISPAEFVKTPANWLKAITKYKGTTAGGPNFTYEYCIERLTEEDKKEIDLSSITTMYCGAEPIRRDTFKRFAKAFKDYNFMERQFYPCYGLAESVLIVTGGDFTKEPVYLRANADLIESENKIEVDPDSENVVDYVGCGHPWIDGKVYIVDPFTKEICVKGKIGEIWTSGPSVCQGYYNKEEETKEVFRAYTSDTNEGPFMRTGDLGFIHDGQLYVTGRLKDMIIIRGQNYYPQDIEKVIEESHVALRQYGNAVFSVEAAGEERLVVVQEIERTYMRNLNGEEVYAAIRDAVAGEFDLSVHHIVLIRTGSILKTTSGKIQRRASKKAYLENNLTIVASSELDISDEYRVVSFDPAKDTIEQWLIRWISRKTNINTSDIDPEKSILSYGLDSIAMVELEREVNKQFGIEIELTDFMERNKIREIVEIGERMLK